MRGNNNKILQEINRNIAKLSTSVNTTHHIVSSKVDCLTDINKAAVANVTSHTKKTKDMPSNLSVQDCELKADDLVRSKAEESKNENKDNTSEGNILTIKFFSNKII